MQAIVETLFDAVYLTSVIAIGVTMIVKSRGNKEHWLFGIMAVVLGAGSGSLHHWSGKLYRPPGHRQIHHLHYHDDLLHHPLLCVAGPVQGQWSKRHYRRRVSAVCPADRPLLLPSECMAEHLPEHSLCAFGPADHRLVLQERPASKGPRVPQYVADHCAQFRFLHSRGPLGRRRPYDWYADDPQDLRLCLDGPDRLQGHECQHRDLIKDTAGCLADSRRYLFHFWTAEVRISRTGLHSVHLPIQIGAPLL